MDGISGSVDSLVDLAAAMNDARLDEQLSVRVLKKSLDAHARNALELLRSARLQPARVNPPHMGQRIDTTA